MRLERFNLARGEEKAQTRDKALISQLTICIYLFQLDGGGAAGRDENVFVTRGLWNQSAVNNLRALGCWNRGLPERPFRKSTKPPPNRFTSVKA
jgi:hypothetical protein